MLAGQITTTAWAGAPSRTWAWSRAIGGAGQFASWTRAAQLRTSTWAEAAVARATVPPPRRSTLRWTCPGRALGEGSGRSGLGAPWTRAAAPSRTWAWSRAIGGAGRGIGGAGQLASWTWQALDRRPGGPAARRRSQPRPGRLLRRGPGPGPGRSVGLAAASVGLAAASVGLAAASVGLAAASVGLAAAVGRSQGRSGSSWRIGCEARSGG